MFDLFIFCKLFATVCSVCTCSENLDLCRSVTWWFNFIDILLCLKARARFQLFELSEYWGLWKLFQ